MSDEGVGLPLSAHRRLALVRHNPGLRVGRRSISCIRFHLGGYSVEVRRPPFENWVVGAPLTQTLKCPPADHEAWALRQTLLTWIDGATPDR